MFATNGASFDTLGEEEKAKVLESLNAMSRRAKKQPAVKPTAADNAPQNSASRAAIASARKAEAERQKKLRNQRELVIEIIELAGKGYPAPVNLDSGAGTQVVAVSTPAPNTP